MKVSIVTISFNQAAFLERAICSVLEQDYPNIEYILVDPGSTDGSRKIIERYRRRLAKIIFEPDKGAADGLNKGFSFATGDVLGFLNSDDVLREGALSKVVNFLLTHPQADVVSGHSLIIDENDRVLRRSYSDKFNMTAFAYSGITLMQASTFFRSSALRKTNGFNIQNKSCWDGELFIDMAMKGATFALMNEFLSGFRLHTHSITASRMLDEDIDSARDRIFAKIMGRHMYRFEVPIRFLFRIRRLAHNPRHILERILGGRVYGRKV